MFKGSFVALVTPFKDGEIDEKKIHDLVDWQITEGTNGIVPVGTTGESATLSHEEHEKVVGIVIKAANKRVPIIAGAGSNCTEEAISLTKEAKALGADGVLSVNPYYNKPTQAGLKAHFSAIAQSADIPVILYNIPPRTNVNLLPETIEALAKENKNIVGVKEATGSISQATEIRRRLGADFSILSGDDVMTLPLMALGGNGVISVAANIVPGAVARLCQLAGEAKMEEAQAMNLKLYPLVKSLFLETNPAPVKAAMKELGIIDNDDVRLPMVPVQKDTRGKIKAAVKEFGVKVPAGVK